MPLVGCRVHLGETTSGRGEENAEALYRPLRRTFRGNKERRILGRVEPLRDWPPPVLCEQPPGEESGRLTAHLVAQAIPPQGQDSGVTPLPRGRKGLRVLPVGHVPTLSPGTNPEQGRDHGSAAARHAWLDMLSVGARTCSVLGLADGHSPGMSTPGREKWACPSRGACSRLRAGGGRRSPSGSRALSGAGQPAIGRPQRGECSWLALRPSGSPSRGRSNRPPGK